MLGFKVEMFGNGKVEISGEAEYPDVDLMSKQEMDAALTWAATALIGTLASRGVSVVGMEKIERGSHIEAKRSEILNSKHHVADILNS